MDNLAALSFPLNIYALLLFFEYGAAAHLHYGHYAYPGEATDQAQIRAVELLRDYLPQTGKLLNTGCGFGALTALFCEQGYAVTGIVSDPVQLEIAKYRYGSALPVRCTCLEDFHEDEGMWDALVFHESGHCLPMLDLFERTAALLKPEGELVLLDAFALRRTTPGTESLHLKEHFLTVAERFGFVCQTDMDCTASVTPFLVFLEYALQKYRTELLTATNVSAKVFDALLQSTRSDLEKYRDGRFGYFLLRLQRKHLPRWQPRQIRPEHQPEVSSLFAKVFGQQLSLEFWQWKYGPGRGNAVGLWQDDELIAHYGGMLRHFYCDGTIIAASQSCDVMVTPQARAILSRKGPFFWVCTSYLEQFVGYGRPYPLAYGFPSDRHYRLSFKLGLYGEPLTQVNELSWPTAQLSPKCWRFWEICPLDLKDSRQAGFVDGLWQAMLQDFGHLVIGVRDAAYWAIRYQSNPQHSYRLLLVRHRLWRTPLAALVVKQEGDRMELLDWVSPHRHMGKLIEAARLFAARSGTRELYLWASDPLRELLSYSSPLTQELYIVVPPNAWTSAPPVALLKGRLWLTGGDTDFH